MTYKIEKELGRGGQGATFLATKGFQKYALKRVDDYDTAMAEAEKLQKAGDHDNVVRVFEVVDGSDVDGPFHSDGGDDSAFIVMDYLDGETLRAVLRRERTLTPYHWLTILLPLLDGLRHIHQCGLVHRDIKPENIMLVDQAPVLIDLGIAKRLGSAPTVQGWAPGYEPPEWKDGNVQDQTYDMYQIALVSYEALYGELLENRDRMRGDLQGDPSPFVSGLGKALENAPVNRPKTVWDWVTSMLSAPKSIGNSDDEGLDSSSDWSETGTRAKVTVASLCAKIEQEFVLPQGCLLLLTRPRGEDGSVAASGQMHLDILQDTQFPGKTLGHLAQKIGTRFGIRGDCIEFRKADGEGLFYKMLHVETMRDNYRSE